MNNIDLRYILEGILVLLFSIGLHEFAHAKAADMAGDETPRKNGRLSLNPLDHFDPLGAMMILFTLIAHFGIGWGKPVPVNPYNFRHPRLDNFKVSVAGVLTNLALAAVFAALLRYGAITVLRGDPVFISIALQFVYVNLGLAFFNLIPLPPLDGSHALSSLLPYELAKAYDRFIGQYGMMLLVILLITGATKYLVREPVYAVSKLLLGY